MYQKDNQKPRRNDDFKNSHSDSRPRRTFKRDGDSDRPRRSFTTKDDDDRPRRSSFSSDNEDRPRRSFGGNGKTRRYEKEGEDRPRFRRDGEEKPHFRNAGENRGRAEKRGFQNRPSKPAPKPVSSHPDTTRLNKYIANAGICSRREADKLIAAGSVTVNGKVVTEMGYQVKKDDVVAYGGETLRSEVKRYFLLNKPKGFITTSDDPQERKTVMMLIDGACSERIYPVGRLDRNTTGLLLFTNDGELAKKLTHPSSNVYKLYHVELDKAVTHEDMKQMMEGIELEDGEIKVDEVQYASPTGDRRVVGVKIHSGRNRIVRRIFEHLGYDVHKLDRVAFAGLTKKDLPRGRYRELTQQEVNFLKMV